MKRGAEAKVGKEAGVGWGGVGSGGRRLRWGRKQG